MDSESGYLCVPERLLNEASDEGEASNVVGGGGLLRPQDPQHLLIDLLLHLLVQSQHVDRPGQGERCLEREPEQEGQRHRAEYRTKDLHLAATDSSDKRLYQRALLNTIPIPGSQSESSLGILSHVHYYQYCCFLYSISH